MAIEAVAGRQKQKLQDLEIGVIDELEDLHRPWGGFLVVDPADTERFIHAYFPDSAPTFGSGHNLQPKILMVLAGQRLSWQYHHRRAELWRAVDSTVGYHKSPTDEEGPLQVLNPGEIVSFGVAVRHRLVGLGDVGVVAEIWQHLDPDNPSDEADIVRLSDDYSRR